VERKRREEKGEETISSLERTKKQQTQPGRVFG
jgi:hypothetical protein